MPLQIHYSVAMPRPESHRFHVTVEVQGWQQRDAIVVLPVWTPGSYLIREFARHVENFRAETLEGDVLRWQRLDKKSWQIKGERMEAFRVRYEVYANELTVRTSHLDETHGYFNGTNLFMYLDGCTDQPVTLSIEEPPGWHSSIALPHDEQGYFHAADYDTLADSPAEIGTHRVLRFEALGKPHEVALWGHGNEDEAVLVRDLKQIVESVANFFDGELPYERYLFIVHLGDKLGGGLEHRDSTTLAVDRWIFQPEREYEKFLRLATHEFFHTWHVKRIRPANLGPFDYTSEVYTPLLWVMEGFTTYYDVLLLRRAEFISPKRMLEMLAERIATYRQQPGRLVQSLEESSLTAWIKLYRQDENYVNSGISYYLKGSLVALMLDLTVRWTSENESSLDDLVRLLWERYGKVERGFTVEAFLETLQELSNYDLTHFLAHFVQGVEELPLEDIIHYAGLRLVSERKEETAEGWLGIRLESNSDGLKVKNVLRETPAEQTGLMAGDRLVALDGHEIRDEAFFQARLGEKGVGDPVRLHLFRYGLLLEKEVRLAETPPDKVKLVPVERPSPLQREILEAWLATEWRD